MVYVKTKYFTESGYREMTSGELDCQTDAISYFKSMRSVCVSMKEAGDIKCYEISLVATDIYDEV